MTSLFHAVSYCHLSATLQTISIIVVTLQDNRDVVPNFIAILRFSADSPSYIYIYIYIYICVCVCVCVCVCMCVCVCVCVCVCAFVGIDSKQ